LLQLYRTIIPFSPLYKNAIKTRKSASAVVHISPFGIRSYIGFRASGGCLGVFFISIMTCTNLCLNPPRKMPMTQHVDLLWYIENGLGSEEMSEHITVLVVEDEVHIRRVLEYNLKLDGFEVYLAEDGAIGLKLAREKHPDVILLDWLMPEMDGLQVLKELRSDGNTAHIPVFMLTAKGMLNDVTQAIEMGADDYITKPFNPIQLGKTIKVKLEKCAQVKKC
jgi:CheY-like chemotaxis protein